ncbi:MAG TPA: MFS transporter [Chitinophagales bacterium]
MNQPVSYSKSVFSAGVIVAAIGYFVDIYDLLLFSIVRKTSIESLGYSGSEIEQYGLWLINIQMTGMLLGGILWGIWADKKGRLSVLFGSILLYSVANILNGFAQNIEQYAILRFIAGVGLAGELGAGITLVTESLEVNKRGIGTMIVGGIGILGAVFAGILSHYFEWRMCYFIGGGLGLLLLILRIGVLESGIYKNIASSNAQRGNFLKLFRNTKTIFKYLNCIIIGLPTWFAVGILVTFSPEFAQILHINGEIKGGDAIMCAYFGISTGDFLCGWLSQLLRSRRKAIAIFVLITAIGYLLYFTAYNQSAFYLYLCMYIIGFGTGFWAVVITNAAEQFGTNIRATVATTVPNFIRGALPLITLFYAALQTFFNKLVSAEIVAVFIIILPLTSLYFLEETFDKNLDYIEK